MCTHYEVLRSDMFKLAEYCVLLCESKLGDVGTHSNMHGTRT